MTPRRLNRAAVVAEYIGADLRDVSDYRYQPSRFVKVPIWAIGSTYLCVARPGDVPPAGYPWEAASPDTWPLPRYPGVTLYTAKA
jgi:hypothetical protein